MEKTENKPVAIGADAAPFKFELSQLVEIKPARSMRMAKTST